MPNEDPNYLDLHDLLPDTKVDFDDYTRCEREVLTPALEAKGYVVARDTLGGLGRPLWYTGERDSCGPLSRCVRVTTPDGEHKIVVYG